MGKNVVSLAGIAASLLIGGAIAFVGSLSGKALAGIPLFALCGALGFIVQWLCFIPAWIYKTEHYFDLTGSLTYLSMTLLVLIATGASDPRALLIGLLVIIWAGRLGTFLFGRIKGAGEDRRFRWIKTDFLRFLMTWTLQGLWVFITYAAGLAAMTASETRPLDVFAAVGLTLWVAGFAIEVIADRQKSAFRADPANENQFISVGLWAWSRHPNYFGEILLWIGIAVIAFPVLAGWQYLTLISPVFVIVLLTKISGIPLLEARAEKQWGETEAYKTYKARTPSLIPFPPARA